MLRKRSILSLLMALVAIVLVSCGGGNENTAPPTYSSEQVEQIQQALPPVKQARQRLTQLEPLLQKEKWSDAYSLLHGPLGGLRREMSYVTRNLLPRDQEQAKEYARALFEDIEKIDAAVEAEVASRALENYDRALNDFDQYLSLIPEPKPSENS